MKTMIDRWTKPGIGSVNTYWIATDEGVVVVDGQRELSSARLARQAIDALGLPIVAAFLTHPHPDHFGGIGVFAPAGVPLYASRATFDSLASDRQGFAKASREQLGDDFPSEIRLPDRFVHDGDTLEIAGVRFVTAEFGAGEAECATVLYLPDERALLSADLVQDRMTAFLLEGRLPQWLDQLDRLSARFPEATTLYPGHGEPGPPIVLIERQKEYLRTFATLVAAERTGGALTAGAATRVAEAMERRFSGYLPVAAIPDLLRQDVAPVAAAMSLHEGGSST